MELQGGEQFTLLVGPAGAGKTAALAARYAAALSGSLPPGSPRAKLGASPRRRWIAPTRTAAAAVREMVVDRTAAVLDPGIATFADVARSVVHAAGARVAEVTPLQRRRLLGRLVEQAATANRLQHFAPLAGARGLVTIVDQALADLASRGQTPADIGRRAEAEGDRRASDLALLFEQYRERLAAAGMVDRPMLLAAAAAALAETRSESFQLDLLVVDGFNEFTTIELALLEQIVPRAKETWLTLPGDSPSEAHEASARTGRGPQATAKTPRNELFAGALAMEAKLTRDLSATVQRVAPSPRSVWPAQAWLERNLFRSYRDLMSPPPEAATSLDRIHIVAASGEQAEVIEIARRVKRLLTSGSAPEEIVVAFRSTRDVADRVRQVFDDYGIPMSLDAGRSLASTALARTLTCVLGVALSDWPYRQLLQAANDRSIRLFEAEPGAQDPRRAIELCIRYAQLPSGRRELFAQLEAWAADPQRRSEPRPPDADLARRALASLAALLDKLPGRASVERWMISLGQLADGLGLLRPATGDTARNWAILEQTLRGAGAMEAIVSGTDGGLTLAEFVELVATSTQQAFEAALDDGVGRVRVHSAEAARLKPCRHLFLGGLCEQAFPLPAAAKSTEAEGAASLRANEMLLFYQLVTRPSGTLTLSYPALDERAQVLPPSPYLAELERVFGPCKISRTEQPLNYAHVADANDAAPLSRTELRRQAVARALDGKRDLLATLAMASDARSVAGPAIVSGIETIARRARRDEFGPFDGLLTSPEIGPRLRREYGPEALWSPSRLERYAECPFRFFGEQLLKLRPTPELVLASDLARRGSVLHATLAQLYLGLGPQGGDVSPEQLAAGVVDQFHAALTDVSEARAGRGVDAAIREIERRQIAAWAEQFAQQHIDYQNHWQRLDVPPQASYFEVRFGPGSRESDTRGDAVLSTDAPFALDVTIDGKSEQAHFTGQVDRLDLGRVGDRAVFNVIDYKTGAKHVVKPDEIHAGRQIQLPLYALAAEQLLLADQDAAPLSVGFWSIAGDGYRAGARSGGPLAMHEVNDGELVPTESWEATRAQLIARIGEMIAAIRRGEFPVFNDNPQCTASCDLRTICRISQVRSLEKQWPLPPGSSQVSTRAAVRDKSSNDATHGS